MSKVILSKKTLDVLKNFSTINSSIVFRQGSTVRTISNAENILAKFTGEEVFPSDFAIYDLSQFLSGISLFNDPQLEFTSSDFVSIRGGRQSAKYYFSDPEITLKSAPEKNVNFPGADIQFNLSGDDLIALQKASAVYSLPDLTFFSEEGSDTIKLILGTKKMIPATLMISRWQVVLLAPILLISRLKTFVFSLVTTVSKSLSI